jgi:uncharacterized membrane protein YdjX (TVP38/TMEM64 family)
MASDGVSGKTEAKANKEDVENGSVTHYLMEYVLPVFLALFAISLFVLFLWVGPVAVFSFMLSYIPKNPGLTDAVILCAVIVVSIVLCTPFWPPLMIVSAMVFGFWKGFLLDFCAMVIGAVLSYLIGKWLLKEPVRDYIQSSDHEGLRRMVSVVEEEGNSFKFTFLFRFLFIPIWIRNYVPSVLNVVFWHFLLSVVCHSVFICVNFALAGSAAKDMAEIIAQEKNPWAEMEPKEMITFAVSLTASLLLSLLAYREYSMRLAEEDEAVPLLKDQSTAGA